MVGGGGWVGGMDGWRSLAGVVLVEDKFVDVQFINAGYFAKGFRCIKDCIRIWKKGYLKELNVSGSRLCTIFIGFHLLVSVVHVANGIRDYMPVSNS